MRLLFVSSTTGGGSGRSQRELAKRLVARGHEVAFLVDDKRPARRTRWLYEQLSDATARWGERPGRSVLGWIESRPGRRVRSSAEDGLQHSITPVPENALRTHLTKWRPDVVVGNSLVRLSWRKIRAECARLGIPTVLYVREVATYGHLEALDDPADVLVANAATLVEGVRERGHDCVLIPSVIDTSVTNTESDRTVALLINPIESHGIEVFWEVARRLLEVRFQIQESWPLDAGQIARISDTVRELPNVEFLRRTEPGPGLYARARMVIVPHQLDNRPRVIAEAQSNGIPIVASDYPGLREAVGGGGVIVGARDIDGWVAAITQLWDDPVRYAEMSAAARHHAERDEIAPERVVDYFERAIQLAVERTGATTPAAVTDRGGGT